MAVADTQIPLQGETTCGTLLQKLQVSKSHCWSFASSISSKNFLWTDRRLSQEIWDEVGETDEERDKMLLQIDQECLDVYKRKVELADKSRAKLLQSLSDAKHELSSLLSALGEKSFSEFVSKYFIWRRLYLRECWCSCLVIHIKFYSLLLITAWEGFWNNQRTACCHSSSSWKALETERAEG